MTLSERVDLEKVLEQISAAEGRALSPLEEKDARECVWVAAERWVPRDLESMRITGVEEEYECPVEGHQMPFHGFVDVCGILNGKKDPFTQFKGQTMVVDWKTKETALDARWKGDMKMSWQWRLYAYLTGAKVFCYRGVSRNVKGVEKTNELILAVPETNDEECRNYLECTFGARALYVEEGRTVWPQRMPYSCSAFGRKCSYEEDCWGNSMPKVVPPPRQMSYSSIGDFWLCPERHRRKSLEEGREETDATIFGLAVHRGLAEIYRQLKEE